MWFLLFFKCRSVADISWVNYTPVTGSGQGGRSFYEDCPEVELSRPSRVRIGNLNFPKYAI
jgi:hypothetical protein